MTLARTDDGAMTFVDWGTTNRRVYRVARGRIVGESADERGVLAVPPNGWEAAVAEVRDRGGPVLMAGMVGSSRGWFEVPYVACPAGLDEIAAGTVWRDGCGIVPGVYQLEPDADVLRGEEVQLLGAVAAGLAPADSLIATPGTHNKWVEMAGGRIDSFRTVMTGEMFGLLRRHSILADLVGADVEPGPAFGDGVGRGLTACGELMSELFRVRAKVLLGKLALGEAAGFASGLLIGADVAIGEVAGRDVVLIGEARLTSLYAAAIAEAGGRACPVAPSQAFIAGMTAIAERLQ